MAAAVVDLLEPVQVDVEQSQLLLAPGPGQGGLQPVVEQGAVRQVGERIVPCDILQPGLGLLAHDGRGDLGGDELQQRLVLLGIAHVAGVALHHQRADDALGRIERYAEPVQRIPADDDIEVFRQGQRVRRQQQRLAGADDFRAERARVEPARRRRCIVLVDEIGEAQFVVLLVVEGDEEIVGGQQVADDLVDATEQREQVLGRVRGFGNVEQRGLHGLGALEFGDVACHGDPGLVGFRPACRPHDVDDLPVLADIAVLEVGFGLSGHDLGRRLQGPRLVRRVHQVDHGPAEDFVRRIAEDALERGTDELVASVDIDHADRIEQQVHHIGKGNVVPGFHAASKRKSGRQFLMKLHRR